MKTLKFGLKALSLVLVPVLLSSSLYADDFVSRKVAEFQGDVENIRKELETAKTQMKRLDYGKIEGILAEICAKLDSSLQPEKTEHEATVILAEVNGLLRDIRPMMEESLPVETRGIWVDNVTMRQLRSRKDVEEFFADMASINVNLVIVDAFNEGAATYPSKVAPEHPESQMYGGDKLRDIVEIAHSKNIEVHALITTFGIGRAGIAHFLDEKMSWLDKH
ncbi:MAG TPA: family 10 glycosylhydrolase, partial [Bacillota bacterium]|nr:family 10 glycosylhydrolase [Bacillota bacterium]